MMTDKDEIFEVLLGVKKKREIDLDDELIRGCYEIQQKHQFDPDRNTVNKMRDLVDDWLSGEGKQ